MLVLAVCIWRISEVVTNTFWTYLPGPLPRAPALPQEAGRILLFPSLPPAFSQLSTCTVRADTRKWRFILWSFSISCGFIGSNQRKKTLSGHWVVGYTGGSGEDAGPHRGNVYDNDPHNFDFPLFLFEALESSSHAWWPNRRWVYRSSPTLKSPDFT